MRRGRGGGARAVDLAQEQQRCDHAVGRCHDVYVGDAEGWHQDEADSAEEQPVSLDQRNYGTFAVLVLSDLLLVAECDGNGSAHQAIRSAVEQGTHHDANDDLGFVNLEVEGFQ